MMPKSLVISIFILSVIQLNRAASKSSTSPENNAQAAFDDLYNATIEFKNALIAQIEEDVLLQNSLLEEAQLSTLDTLNKKLDTIKNKILQIEEALKPLGIISCTVGEASRIEAQRTRLINRTKKCTKLTSDTIDNLASAIYADITLQEDGILSCHRRSLLECQNFKTDDTCYDFVVNNIQKVRDNLEKVFDLIKINFESKIASLKLPCQDLIQYEISIYPDYILQTISQCADNMIRNSRPNTCSSDVL